MFRRLFKSDEDDCQHPQWYHQHCFFKTRLPLTEAVFDGFPQLRYSDQTAIRNDLGSEQIFFLRSNFSIRRN